MKMKLLLGRLESADAAMLSAGPRGQRLRLPTSILRETAYRFLLIECCKSLSDPRGFPFWREPLLDQLFQPCRLRRTNILSHTAPILAHSNPLPKKTSSPQNPKGGKTQKAQTVDTGGGPYPLFQGL